MRSELWARALATAVLIGGLAGCASKPAATADAAAADADDANDPYESTNRFFYGVNDTLDRYTLKPAAEGYVAVVPRPVRTGIHNWLANLSSPVQFADDVSQARPRNAGDTFMRFVINSTVGVVGIFDVAKSVGYPTHDTDFNVTLALWGVPSGPYLYLPVLGPNTFRSATAFGINTALDPFTYVPHGYGLLTLNWARYGLGAIDTRSLFLKDIDRIKANALDPYATFRSLYRQSTDAQIQKIRANTAVTPPDWE